MADIKNYEIISTIGSGSFGKVYKAVRSDGTVVALKVIDLTGVDPRVVDLTKTEIEILKKISSPVCHPFIVCYYDSEYDQKNNRFIIEMEYIEGKDMIDFVNDIKKDFPEDQFYRFLLLTAKDLAVALEYIHNENVIHNDIKIENIIIDKNFIPKLIDFGFACNTQYNVVYGKYCKHSGGSPDYIPPEFITLKIRIPASDMWALGVTLYAAVTGLFPYEGDTLRELSENIETQEPPRLNTNNKLLNDVVNGLLQKSLSQRLSAKKLSQLLKDYS